MPPLPNSPYRLLAEGTDDVHSVIHLMAQHGYGWDDERLVRPYVDGLGGIAPLLEALPVALKGSYARLGFVLDADLNLSDRWAQVRDRAHRVGLKLPDSPAPACGPAPGSAWGSCRTTPPPERSRAS